MSGIDWTTLTHRALVEHLRTWWGSDALDYEKVQKEYQANGFCAETINNICRKYHVSRSLNPEAKKRLPDELLSLAKRWPYGFSDRQQAFSKVTGEWKERYHRHFVSGFSKLIWFVHPRGWTMFDSLAADAVGIGYRNNSGRRSVEFYRWLEKAEFTNLCEEMREILKSHGFDGLFPERVIDKLLMILGRGDALGGVAFASERLPELVGTSQKDCVQRLSIELAKVVARSQFATRLEKAQ